MLKINQLISLKLNYFTLEILISQPINQSATGLNRFLIRTIHLDLITLQCTDCPRKFNQKSALRRHIKVDFITDF